MAPSRKRVIEELEAKYNLQAVIQYVQSGSLGQDKAGKDTVLKAKQHLKYEDWTFSYASKRVKNEICEVLRYHAPNEKKGHLSLKYACKAYLQKKGIYDLIMNVSVQPRDVQIVDKAEHGNNGFDVGVFNEGIHCRISDALQEANSHCHSSLENCDVSCNGHLNQLEASFQDELTHVPEKTMDIVDEQDINSQDIVEQRISKTMDVSDEQIDINSQDIVEQQISFDAYECHIDRTYVSDDANYVHGFEPQQENQMLEIAENQTSKNMCNEFTDEGASAQEKFSPTSVPQLQIETQSVAEQGNEILSNAFGFGLLNRGANLDDFRDLPNEQERLAVCMAGGLGDFSGDRTGNQVREVDDSSCRLRNFFTLLIEQNIVLLGESVHYRGRQGTRMAEGRVYKDGIKCNCCHQSFSLSHFEAHAGSTNRRPAANIFLEDGRSLSDCRLQLKQCNQVIQDKERNPCSQMIRDKVAKPDNQVIKDKEDKMTKPSDEVIQDKVAKPHNQVIMDKVMEPRDQVIKDKVTKPGKQILENDDYCLVCHGGDDLLSCGSCPSSFHLNCVKLKRSPTAKCMYCPSCCCGICGAGQMKTLLFRKKVKCKQCGHPFHLECLRQNSDSIYLPNKEWFFCTSTCEFMFLGLCNILWKPTEVAGSNLNCTFLLLDLEGMKVRSNAALKLVEQSLKFVNDPLVIGRISKLKLLVLRGYYLLLLRRDDDEVITTAFVRVHVGKVAEVSLVATRLQFQRRGMCRILMNFLESKLVKLGVERLVLSAAPSMEDTWIGGFGFVKMTEEERLRLLDCTFLDFPSTILLQRMLKLVDDISSDSYREDDTNIERKNGLQFPDGTAEFPFSMPTNDLNPIEQSLQKQPFDPWALRLEKLRSPEKEMTEELIEVRDVEDEIKSSPLHLTPLQPSVLNNLSLK